MNDHRFAPRVPFAARVMVIRGDDGLVRVTLVLSPAA